MHAHRGARAFGVVTRDRFEDAFVFEIHERQVSIRLRVCDACRVEPVARNERAAHLREDVNEVAVARCARDRSVELEIGVDAVLAAVQAQHVRRQALGGAVVASVLHASGVTTTDEFARLLKVFAETVGETDADQAEILALWSETVAAMLPPQPKH